MRVIIWMVLMLVSASPAQAIRASLGVGVGGGHMPMTDYKDFLNMLGGTHYSPDDISLYMDVVGRIALADQHVLRLSIGRVSMRGDAVFPGDGLATATSVAKIRFRTVPIGAAYEFCFRGFDNGSSTFVAAGASIYISKFGADVLDLTPGLSILGGDRTGEGFGVEALLGQRAKVSDRLSLAAQVRGRWADAFLFSDEESVVTIKASGFDLSFYGEWRFD